MGNIFFVGAVTDVSCSMASKFKTHYKILLKTKKYVSFLFVIFKFIFMNYITKGYLIY